jgi:Ser/Thr protein kinase RdoA (MazF antagonist)
MVATRARVTAPPDDLVRAVEQRYGFRISVRKPLAGGHANDVFLVDSPRGALVLRRKHPPSDPVSIGWEHRLLARLASDLPEIPAPVRALDGSTFLMYAGDAVWLVPAVRGVPADRRDECHRVAAARLLGRLHRATCDVEAPARRGVDGLAQLPSLGVDGLPAAWRERVARQRDEALALLAEVGKRRPRTGVVHGDFFPGNVLVRDAEVVGLVDWEEAHVGWLATDLATGAWEFCRRPSGDDFDRAAADRFIEAYRKAGGAVPDAEDDVLVPLIRIKRVLEVLRAPTDRDVDWEYQGRNVAAFNRLG